jgi:hypothetical protein
MDSNQTSFNRGVIRPFECLSEAWALIKDQYWLFVAIAAVGLQLGSVFAIVLMGPMMCGVYRCIFTRMRNEPVRFEELFRGFDYFLESLIATVIQMIPMVVIMLPVYLIGFGLFGIMAAAQAEQGGGEMFPVVFLVGMLVTLFGAILVLSLLMGVFFAFVYPLIVDRKLSGIDALKTSISSAMANFGGLLGLALLNVILSFAGVLLCYVGAFLILPVTLTAMAVAYRRVFPENPESPSALPAPSIP